MMLRIDRATEGDLNSLLKIAADCRDQYRQYQSQFWRPARDAVHRQREYFGSLLHDEQALVAAARSDFGICGFAIGRILSAPPVYDPGGSTCVVDDFAVVDAAWAEVGPPLLDAIRDWSAARGATQVVVVTAHLDRAKRAMVQAAQLELTSEWWTGRTTAASTRPDLA